MVFSVTMISEGDRLSGSAHIAHIGSAIHNHNINQVHPQGARQRGCALLQFRPC